MVPTAPLELKADAEVVLAVATAPILLVAVVIVLLEKMSAWVEVGDVGDVDFTVT